MEHSLDSRAQVGEEVPPISDLRGLRPRDLDGLRVRAGTVSGDDFDGGMFTQPCSHCHRLAPGKHLNGFTALQIDDDGAVVCPFAIAQSSIPMIRGGCFSLGRARRSSRRTVCRLARRPSS
jgi:hypothetical protein